MNGPSEHVLLLVGSPKGLEKSNSARLGRLVVDGLEARGWTSDAIHLHAAVRTDEERQRLIEAIGRANAVLFAAPLYVDSLPSPAIRALEWIAAHWHSDVGVRAPRFVSVLNCGFLEPSHNDTCQQVLHRFADRVGLDWQVGVSLGGSGPITKRVRQAVDILVEALDLELLIPDEVTRLTRRPIMPRWLNIVIGNLMWRRLAGKNGVRDRLGARPYESSAS